MSHKEADPQSDFKPLTKSAQHDQKKLKLAT